MTIQEESKKTQLSELAAARQEAYIFLSNAFTEPPSAERITSLRSDAFLRETPALFGADAAMVLKRFTTRPGSVNELHQEARQEFMNLFKVPTGQYLTPYESVFRDTREVAGKPVKGLLMGPSAVDVQKWYKLAALEICAEYKDLPDHICLELNYLAHLCGKEQEFAAAGGKAKLTRAWEMQRDFLSLHVVSWIGKLRGKVYEKSRHG